MSSSNPFNSSRSRPKHKVLGRVVRGTRRRSSNTTSKAVRRRNQSLQQEFRKTQRNQQNEFVDKRFGERDDSLTVEDRDLMRLRRVREKQFKVKSDDSLKIALLKAREDEDLENFKDTGRQDQDFGSAGGTRTHREVMHEIIQKSKMHKALDAEKRDEQIELRQDLDGRFDQDFRDMLMNVDQESGDSKAEQDDYDQMLRSLTFEARMRAQDRTKTEEEIATETYQKLQKLEHERQERMQLPDTATFSDEELEGLDEPEGENQNVDDEPEELPFVLEMPESFESLSELLAGRDAAAMDEAIRRIRTCYHRSLRPENGKMLMHFLGVLIDFMTVVVGQEDGDLDYIEDCLGIYQVVCNNIHELCVEQNVPAVKIMKEPIARMYHESFKELVYPKTSDLAYLSACLSIFPSTDYDHSVATLIFLYLGDCLQSLPVVSPKDLLKGLYICDLLLTSTEDSEKIFPQVLTFLCGVLSLFGKCDSSVLKSRMPIGIVFHLKSDKFCGDTLKNWDSVKCSLLALWLEDSDEFFSSDEFANIIVSLVLSLIKQASTALKPSICYNEFMCPIKLSLRSVSEGILECPFKNKVEELCEEISTFSSRSVCSRVPLFIKKKVFEIRELEPSFDERGLGPENSADRNKARVEEKKRKRKFRRERSGARREQRQKSSYINQEKKRFKSMEDDRKEQVQKREMQFLQGLAADSNLLRRNGRKKVGKPELEHA